MRETGTVYIQLHSGAFYAFVCVCVCVGGGGGGFIFKLNC